MVMIPEPTKLILVTGTSGAGMSTALNFLEDLGIKAVDNVPLALIDQLVALEVETAGHQLAVGLDVRTSGFTVEAVHTLATNLRHKFGDACSIVFVTAGNKDLMRRFNATRRQHPLGDNLSLADAIAADVARMSEVETLADIRIDTTGLKPADTRRYLLESLGASARTPLPVRLVSFSYRHGLPEDADIVIDMRFAENPHWVDGLREKTGSDSEVDEFLSQDAAAQSVIKDVKSMLTVMSDRMSAEGRPIVTIGFGCTGGRHGSVWGANMIADWFSGRGHEVATLHRELARKADNA